MLSNANDAIHILSIVFILFFIFFLGIFSYRFSVSLDKEIIKSIGDLFYRLVCKSGFMVLVIVIVTYFICKSESDRQSVIVGDNSKVVASTLNKEH